MSEKNEVIAPGEKSKIKLTRKQIFSWVAIALGFLAVILYIVLPAIKIDPSYAAKTAFDSGKGNIADIKGWSYIVMGFAAIFGIGTYDTYVVTNLSDSYTVNLQQDKMAFNIMMLVAVIVSLATIVLYLIMILKKKKNNTLNKVVMGCFFASALLILLSAVWFYAANPIIESNYYDTVSKTDTVYKYVNAHLSAGPIISFILLIGSGVFASLGEY